MAIGEAEEPTPEEMARFFRHLASEEIKKAHRHRREAEKWLNRAEAVKRREESKKSPENEPEE